MPKQGIGPGKEDSLGGVCVNTGTFPSKTLREAVLHLTGHLKKHIFDEDTCTPEGTDISMEKLKKRLQQVRVQEHAIIDHQLQRNGVDLIRGTASFVDSHTVQVKQANLGAVLTFSAKFIIIATGSRPRNPPRSRLMTN